ncbi:hypothetical protein GGR57DRAFT_438100 [Xylariaceae sp. FL1272]|nr:hypothetical protein GGR57DRAFT_438100 [Xylariaceae sp. FL1272]
MKVVWLSRKIWCIATILVGKFVDLSARFSSPQKSHMMARGRVSLAERIADVNRGKSPADATLRLYVPHRETVGLLPK